MRLSPRRSLALLVPFALLLVLPARPALAQAGAISGIVYVDANGSGQRDPGEAALANVTVTVTSGAGTATVVTNADGGYFFTANVGDWKVSIAPPPGFEVEDGALRGVNVAGAEQNMVVDFALRPIQAAPTSTVPPPQPTNTPGVLPTTGAPVGLGGLILLALLAAFILGVGLLISAWKRGNR